MRNSKSARWNQRWGRTEERQAEQVAALKPLTIAKLKVLAAEHGIKVPSRMRKDEIVVSLARLARLARQPEPREPRAPERFPHTRRYLEQVAQLQAE